MPMCVFLFQAEDGIRARNVTGVQTCALPIFSSVSFRKSFISFFSAEVIDRVETFYRKAVEEESGEQGAIVLRDRSSQVDRAVEEAYGEIKTDQRKAPDLDIDGALAGREAGERADVTLD